MTAPRRWFWTLVALGAAGVFLFALVVPGAPVRVDVSGWDDLASRTVAGAYHVHTTRSDGRGDRDAVAAAARRAGLTFVILTDHGDGTRPPDPPTYVDGVLVLDAVEISTDQGHYVALEMPRAPYPLGGAADTVVEDVRRLGGFGIAAHPDSPKAELRWADRQAPIDGLEWLNADSEWRDESRAALVRAGLAYVFRPGPALATLLDRPSTLAWWDELSRSRRIVALAGADAHGGPGMRAEDQGHNLAGAIGVPSYDASFAIFSNRAVLERPLSGDAAADGHAIYAAIRRGSVFTTIDALARPGLLDFRRDGDAIVARAAAPPGATVVLLRGGQEVASAHGGVRYTAGQAPAAYRVEVRLPRAPGTPPVPWLVSNVIYTGAEPAPLTAASPPPAVRAPRTAAPFSWRLEHDPSSRGILRFSSTTADLEYTLGGPRHSQFVAIASDLDRSSFSAIALALATDRPARISVQVRTADGRRWGRSVYVDASGVDVELPLSSLRPIPPETAGPPPSTDIRSVILAVDLTNAPPGRSGAIHVLASALVK